MDGSGKSLALSFTYEVGEAQSKSKPNSMKRMNIRDMKYLTFEPTTKTELQLPKEEKKLYENGAKKMKAFESTSTKYDEEGKRSVKHHQGGDLVLLQYHNREKFLEKNCHKVNTYFAFENEGDNSSGDLYDGEQKAYDMNSAIECIKTGQLNPKIGVFMCEESGQNELRALQPVSKGEAIGAEKGIIRLEHKQEQNEKKEIGSDVTRIVVAGTSTTRILGNALVPVLGSNPKPTDIVLDTMTKGNELVILQS